MPSGQATPAQDGGTQAGPSSDTQTKPKDLVVVTDKVKAVRIRDSDKRIINQYEFEECLGKGQHGQVWVAKDVRTDQFVVRRAATLSCLLDSCVIMSVPPSIAGYQDVEAQGQEG